MAKIPHYFLKKYFLCILAFPLYAQQYFFYQPVISPPSNIFSLQQDSSVVADTVISLQYTPTKSTTVALLSSAILPGAGQIYNESYWKAPIIWGVGGYFVYAYSRQNNLYHRYQTEYANSITEENPTGNLNKKSIRDFYRGERDNFAWYMAILYVANLVDAYVDASLFDFDAGPNLQGQNQIQLKMKIPLK